MRPRPDAAPVARAEPRPLRALLWGLSLVLLGAALSVYVVRLFERGVIRFNYPSRGTYPVQGIDVSHHQGGVDWPRLRGGGMRFAYIKASEGADFVDEDYATNREGALAAGLVPGPYHYFTLCTPGAAQGAHFIAIAPRPAEPSLPPAVDLEYGGNCSARPTRADFQRELRAFLDVVEAHWGCRATLYVTQDFYAAYLQGEPRPNPLWVRDIYRTPRLPDDARWTLWQYANRGTLDGIRGFVDFNAFAGGEAEFARFRCGV